MKPKFFILLVAILAGNLLAQSIELPPPQKSGGMPLMEALAKRSTARAFATNDLSPRQISSLLWAAFGINRPDGKRTAPSAMDRQEMDIYVLLEQGAYVYSAASNKLDLVVAEDIRALGGTQAFVKDAPVTLVLVADLAKEGGNTENAASLRTTTSAISRKTSICSALRRDLSPACAPWWIVPRSGRN